MPRFPSAVGLKSNLTATVAPTVNDDITLGYVVGSEWVNLSTDKAYMCLDNTDAAAVWTEITQAGGAPTTELGKYSLSSNILHSHDDVWQGSGGGWQKAKTITLNDLYPSPTTIRVKFTGTFISGTPGNSLAQIRKNGATHGTSRVLSGTWTEDLSYEDGDALELYLGAGIGNTASVQDFRILGDMNVVKTPLNPVNS